MAIFSGKKYKTCIEIDKGYLKIVQQEPSSKTIAISKIIIQPIAALSDDEISKSLTDITKANNISLDSVTAVVSREKTMVRTLRLPATETSEVENMISFEAAKQIPYSKEEIVSDYSILRTDSEGYTDIMLVVAHKNEINRIDDILKGADSHSNNIRLSSEGISAWLKLSAPLGDISEKNICLVDIDTTNTEIAIVSNGILTFSRVASIGADNISEPESIRWIKRLAGEVKGYVSMYVKEQQKDASLISDFLVTGANSCIEDFAAAIKLEFEQNSQAVNVLSSLSVADDALGDEGIADKTSVCAVCGALFIEEGINLVAKEVRRKKRYSAKLQKLVGISVLGAIIIGLSLTLVFLQIFQKKKQLATLKVMLKTIEPAAKVTEDKLKKVEILKGQFSEGASSLDVIYNLYKLIPSSISLIDFDYDDSSRVTRFRGKSAKMSDVFKLVTILEGSESFSKVETRSVAKRRTRQGETVDFQIRCNFVPKE
ncbi:MAG: pilus assembly protein PilM [Candidatus Omnitrophica bacterium]|nr:pilus assembly protein PilM [Candidatus Omnitrophota bacterium]